MSSTSRTILGFTAVALAAAPVSAATLDGIADVEYSTIATDPSGDLASPGPADWSGTAWADLTTLRVTNDATHLFVHIASPGLDQDGSEGDASSGLYTLAIDLGSTSGTSADPWGRAITYGHANLPDFIVIGKVNGDFYGEFLTADGSNGWTGFGSNFAASNVARSDNNGIEIQIPLASLGVGVGDALNLLALSSQEGGSKGAYDSVPADDQSTGWDDATTHTSYAQYTVVPEPAGLALLGLGALVSLRRRRH